MITTATSAIKRLFLLFLIIGGLYLAKTFLIPIAIGGVLATLFLPLARMLEKKRIPKIVASLLCIFVLLFCVSAIGAVLGWQVSSLLGDYALIKQQAAASVNIIQEYILVHSGISVEKQLQILNNDQLSVPDIMQSLVASAVYIISGFVLTLAYIILFLYYRHHLKEFCLKITQPSQRDEMSIVLSRVAHVSQLYLLGLAKMIFCLWIMYGVGFSLLGIKNALFFAVLCGLLEIVPFIGNITGTTLTVVVAAVQGAGFPLLAGIVATYGVVQLIQGWVLEPVILGPQVKINPFTTIIALVLGELIWGIPGIFLAIPLVAMAKIVCDHVEALKPYGFLIGAVETKNKSPLKLIARKIKSAVR